MKKLIGLLLATGITLGSFAQARVIRGNINTVRPSGGKTTVVVVPRSSFYSPYAYGLRPYGMYPYGYSYYNMYGFAPQAQYREPTKLDLEIEQIKSDYHHEISDARHDQSVSKQERKQRVRDLKHERDNAIIAAKQDYYNSRERRY